MVRSGFRPERCGNVFWKTTEHLERAKPENTIVKIYELLGVNSLTSFNKNHFPFLQTGARKLDYLQNSI